MLAASTNDNVNVQNVILRDGRKKRISAKGKFDQF
jgi:hypothetical protein